MAGPKTRETQGHAPRDGQAATTPRPTGNGTHPRPRTEEAPDRVIRGSSSLSQLVDAYRHEREAEGQDSLRAAVSAFERENGEIRESYFTPTLDNGAVLVRPSGPRVTAMLPRNGLRRRLLVRYAGHDIGMLEPQFEKVLWRTIWTARRTERESDYLLTPRTRKVLAESLHQIAAYLLGTVDALAQHTSSWSQDEIATQLGVAAATARDELAELEHYAKMAATRAAIRYYLYGLPVGLGGLAAVVTCLWLFVDPWTDTAKISTTAVIAGAVGSMTSVMIRITRGQKLSVDIHQGQAVTIVAGSFRPMVGAIFGVAIYVLVVSKLLPLDVPTANDVHFFAGLAFIAGFSERWAQDTIMRSAPIAPSPVDVHNSDFVPHDDRAQSGDASTKAGL